jgi:Beta-lactamase class C and other penicillin binding proteins
MAAMAWAGAVPAQEAAGPEDIAAILAQRIDRDGQGVGLAAAIVSDGTPQIATHGVLAAGGTAPVTPDTLFEIGSITKVFTNLLLAQLVLEGRMALDRPVADYLPAGTAVPRFGDRQITLFDLATHHSGLPAVPPEMMFADPADPYAAYSAEMLMRSLGAYDLVEAPGTRFAYSNTGAALLGLAVSHVAGAPYAELVETRILDVLGMEDTMLVVPPAEAARFATGHDVNGDAAGHWDFDVFAAAGGYRSTVGDMAKFVAAASGRTETGLAAAFALMLERTRPAGGPGVSIGLGWMITETPRGRIVWHNGITGGFNAFAGYADTGGRGAVVLANRVSAGGIEDIGFHLIDPDLPLRPPPSARESVEIDPAALRDYVGTYRLAPDFALSVTESGGRLFAQATGQARFELFAEGGDRFFYRVVDARLSFTRDAAGAVDGLVLHQNGRDVPGRRE